MTKRSNVPRVRVQPSGESTASVSKGRLAGLAPRFVSVALLLSFALCLQSSVSNGNKTVTTAGTRVALSATSVPVMWVTIQAKFANTGSIYVGGSTVASTSGIELKSGDSYHFQSVGNQNYYNLNEIYIDSSVNSEGVLFTYAARP